jgi:CheY-like chemotaxis protein
MPPLVTASLSLSSAPSHAGEAGVGAIDFYGIVSQSGGHIEVDSAPGTRDGVQNLPPRSSPAVIRKPSASTASLQQGSETVLIVEEKDEVRAAIGASLEMRGYSVLKACHGKEAVMICRRHEGPIHLLLTDVVMAQMTGSDLAKRVSLVHPETKVLYISGYTSEVLNRRT